MKRFKVVLSLLLILLAVGGVRNATVPAQRPYIAVIAKSTQSSFWKSVQAGANAAASEYNLEFTFEGPESEEDWRTQNHMIEQAIANGAAAIVFSATDYKASVPAVEQAAERGVYVVVIDSDVDSERVSVRIGTDNYDAGGKAAESLLKGAETPLHIGVVGFDVHTENGQARERGFSDAVAQSDHAEIVEKINVPSKSDEVQAATRELLQQYPEINALATFNEITTLGVGHAIEEMGGKDRVRVVGFDNNVVSVGMLETGEVDTLIVQSPYAMGYLGLESAALLVSGRQPSAKWISTEVRAIDRVDMYTEQNQKFLFSFTENH